MIRRLFKFALVGVLLLILAGAIGSWWGHRQLIRSLPQLSGEVTTEGLIEAVVVERDDLGIPTLRAKNRVDLAFATGFVHAQDRFFQMDLLRRNSAGELSELVGEAVLEHDTKVRVNQFRERARRRLESERKESLEILESYARGVNAGLGSLKSPPFEYLLLSVQPEPWKPEDSLLVIFSMFLDLQDDQFTLEVKRHLLKDHVSPALFDFLMARGNQWDAPIHGQAFEVPDVPGPDAFDARKIEKVAVSEMPALNDISFIQPPQPGSNNWAVSGKHTSDGRALVVNDMHLRIQVPHIWYRASFVWPETTEPLTEQRITGVSLPGAPAMIVGSNGHIAWGFTNTEGDWSDVIIVQPDPQDPDSYLTADGPKKFQKVNEVIKVKGQPDRNLEILQTIWGPVVQKDHQGRQLAHRWVAHDTEGVNFGLLYMEGIKDLDAALEQANGCGAPHQNFVVADDKGRIAWTVMGRIPRRQGHDGWLPRSWADGTVRWDGYLEPSEYPRVADPEVGRIWTANARVVSDEFYKIVGDSNYDRGARQMQIRDGLLALDKAAEADMLKIQLDDRALFLEGWRNLLLEVLDEPAVKGNEQRAQLRTFVENWGGRAAPGSVGYRAVWQFRNMILGPLSDLICQPCKKHIPKYTLAEFHRTEGPLWKIVTQRPDHFLDPRFESWQAFLLSGADRVIEDALKNGGKLEGYTWGAFNTFKIQHPLSQAIPALSQWLDMPVQEIAGSRADMPRIQGPNFGASQRMAVSPGKEQEGYMHIPCGQSGHPLSPHYSDSHADWVEGRPRAFLPGQTIHTLTLKPN